MACLRAGLLCNDALLVQGGERWNVQGGPTEGALVVAAGKAGFEAHVLRQELPRIDAIPFESEHQYKATLHDQGPGLPRVAYLKGSVESVLQRCALEATEALAGESVQDVVDGADGTAQIAGNLGGAQPSGAAQEHLRAAHGESSGRAQPSLQLLPFGDREGANKDSWFHVFLFACSCA